VPPGTDFRQATAATYGFLKTFAREAKSFRKRKTSKKLDFPEALARPEDPVLDSDIRPGEIFPIFQLDMAKAQWLFSVFLHPSSPYFFLMVPYPHRLVMVSTSSQ
jgi:hypothetical protein